MKRSQPLGFTLIELLVVVSIIALLIAILLPALSRARISASESLCKSNLKQIVIASVSYATEDKGRFPNRGANISNNTDVNWATTANPVLDTPGNDSDQDARDMLLGYLTDYTLESPSAVMYCPLMPIGTGFSFEDSWPSSKNVYEWGYGYLGNAFASKDDWRWQGSEDPPKNLEAPSGQSLWTDITRGVFGQGWYSVPHTISGQGWAAETYTPAGEPENKANTPAGTHSGKVDGSVEFERYKAGANEANQDNLEYSVKHGGQQGWLQSKVR
ncbi:MAG: prepilin-type N-terminal cleavage/methylation domain-containing protein [Planctomycetota bacterium]